MRTVIVLSGKGGVGKSTVSTGLAYALSGLERKTGLLDCDIEGPCIPKLTGLEKADLKIGDLLEPAEREGLAVMSLAFFLPSENTPVLWGGERRGGIIKQFFKSVSWGNLDYMVVDLPPGTGDEVYGLIEVLGNIDGAIIVTQPSDLSVLSARKAISTCKEYDVPIIGIIENMSGMVCPHCGKNIEVFKTGGGRELAKDVNVSFLGKIPFNPQIVCEGDQGDLTALRKNKDLKKIAKRVLKFMEGKM